MHAPNPLERLRLQRCFQCGYHLHEDSRHARCPECGIECEDAILLQSALIWVVPAMLFIYPGALSLISVHMMLSGSHLVGVAIAALGALVTIAGVRKAPRYGVSRYRAIILTTGGIIHIHDGTLREHQWAEVSHCTFNRQLCRLIGEGDAGPFPYKLTIDLHHDPVQSFVLYQPIEVRASLSFTEAATLRETITSRAAAQFNSGEAPLAKHSA